MSKTININKFTYPDANPHKGHSDIWVGQYIPLSSPPQKIKFDLGIPQHWGWVMYPPPPPAENFFLFNLGSKQHLTMLDSLSDVPLPQPLPRGGGNVFAHFLIEATLNCVRPPWAMSPSRKIVFVHFRIEAT